MNKRISYIEWHKPVLIIDYLSVKNQEGGSGGLLDENSLGHAETQHQAGVPNGNEDGPLTGVVDHPNGDTAIDSHGIQPGGKPPAGSDFHNL